MKYFVSMMALVGLALVGCGGGVSQSAACAAMIACDDALEAADTGTYTATDWTASYGDTGTCWSTTQLAADVCDTACVNALDGLITAGNSLVTAGTVSALPSECAQP